MSNHFIYFLYNINGSDGAFSNTVDKLIEIIQERLKREFNLDLIVTPPSVIYKIIKKDISSFSQR